MSWLRTAVNRAVEAGGNNNLTRTVRSVADTVVQQAGNAVSEGAKLIQDRIGVRNLNSFKQTVKRLEEVSVSCRGTERVQMLRRWLVALKEVERLSAPFLNNNNEKDSQDQLNSDDTKDSPKKPTLVYYSDPDMVGEPFTFRDVFLYSQALEGITLSVILEAPNDEEVSLLLEIFGLCLAGRKDVHSAVLSSIQDLATAFSDYQDEVLIKREELLQHAQGAIAGLKINADRPRIDAEVCSMMETLDKMKPIQQPSNADHSKVSEETPSLTTEVLKEAFGQIQICSKVEELLLKKKSFSNGNSPELHAEKVHKLKIFSESLANSTSQAEKRIIDHRSQKEDALNFRLARANEIGQLEKYLSAEIRELEKQKDELEAEMKKVKTSLATSRARLHNAKEEREQFDEASNQILIHLKSKEDELSRSCASCRTEANVVNTFVSFLEDTWVLQTACNDQKEKEVNGELKEFGDHFVVLVIHFLSTFKEQLSHSVPTVRKLADKLHLNGGSEIATRDSESPKSKILRKSLEEEYLELEAKLVTTLSIVDAMQKQFYMQNEGVYRKDTEKVKELFDAMEKIKGEFQSIVRPTLEVESPRRLQLPLSDKIPFSFFGQIYEAVENKQEKTEYAMINQETELDANDELEKLESAEIVDWEFDAFEKDIKPSG